MIGVVVPAYNEELLLPGCLAALRRAALHPDLQGEEVRICVVLDACTDGSESIVKSFGVEWQHEAGRNVGRARAAGAKILLEAGARWLAFTDADSRVADDWLPSQLALHADAVCGVVVVDDWATHPTAVRTAYEAAYRDADGHRHVHGANLGVSRDAYVAVGGFEPKRHDEDVSLVAALEHAGFSVAWSAGPRVSTSARIEARAPHGFASAIRALYAAPLLPTSST